VEHRRGRGRRAAALVTAVARRYWGAGGPNWSAAVALRLLLALLPIAVLAGLVTQQLLPHTATPHPTGSSPTPVVRQPGRHLQIEEQSLSSLLTGLIGDLHHSGHTLGIVSVLGLLWVGSGLFACLETAAAALFGCPGRPYIRQRLLGMGLVVAFAAVVVAGVASSVLLFPLGSVVRHTGTVGRSLVNHRVTLQPAIGLAMGVAVFALVYRLLPTCRQRWTEVLPGVALAATGNTVLNLIWPLYLRSADTAVSVSHFVFGFVVAIATYVYVLAQVVVAALALNATLRARRLARSGAAAGMPGVPAVAALVGTSPAAADELPAELLPAPTPMAPALERDGSEAAGTGGPVRTPPERRGPRSALRSGGG
jgi:membrane protein